MERKQIDVERRRKGAGPVGRAEEPRREREPGGVPPPGGGLPRPPLFGGRMPSRGVQAGGCGTLLLIVLAIGYYLLTGGQGLNLGGGEGPAYDQGEPGFQQPQPALPTSNFTPPAPAASGRQTWTVMLYQDADDQILEQDIYLDLNEAERIGSSPNVNIVAQIDRFRAGYQGDGDWTSARRYYVTQDSDLNRVGSRVVQELGEVDMAAPQTLVDFVRWSAQNFPADKYVLILSDHGMGWPGGWRDPSHSSSTDSRAPLASRLGNQLYLMDLDQALAQARAAAGIGKFEIVGMDACLMSQLEVMAALQPHANYAIASEEVEPAIGWAYASFLGELVQNPDMSGAELSRAIVDSYVVDDQRIQDPAARAELLRSGSPLGGLFGGGGLASADQLVAQMGRDATIAAVDLNVLPNLMTSFNDFAYQLQGENQQLVAQARNYAQSYTSIFGREVPPSYIDLGHFVLLLQANTSNARVRQAADAVVSALRGTIVAEKHGARRPGSTGLSIYFPNSALYASPLAGPPSYVEIADRFASASLWDDFLAYHYLNRDFTSAAAPYVPPSGYSTRAPGIGDITVSEITASSDQAAPDQPVTLSMDVSGSNVGYIYLFAGYFDQSANSLNVTDVDYLESPETRELNGVYYPVWPEDGFTLNFTWEPIVFGISDGTQNAVALFRPDQYGADAASATYTVEGIYTFAQTGEKRYAQLTFQNGVLVRVLGFLSETDAGAPREITPEAGDTFTIYEKWMDMDAEGNVTGIVKEEGRTLTFGTEPFRWVELYAAAGEYVVGFIVEDVDGNQYPVYTGITVE